MKAVVLTGPGTLDLVERSEPDPDGLAIVAVDQVGICGTDLKIHAGHIPVAYPRIVGHELVGRVVDAGDGALRPGTRVLVDPAVACGRCKPCRRGRPNLCRNGALMGRDVDGGLAERIAVDPERLHLVPDSISSRAAALIQVLGTCVHAETAVAGVAPGVAVVIGLGVAGLLHLQLLRLAGHRVVGVGRSPEKRALAMELGAEAAVEPGNVEELVADLARGDGADLVVEAVGTVGTLAQAIRLAGLGATVLVFGTITESKGGETFPWYDLYYKELTIVNPRAAIGSDYDAAISMAADHKLELEPLWSAAFSMADAAAAYEALRPGSANLKVTIEL